MFDLNNKNILIFGNRWINGKNSCFTSWIQCQ